MKNLKKIASLLLALVMVFALATTASAATGTATSGSITIKGTEADKNYDLYRIFNITSYSVDETDPTKVESAVYTINSSWANFFNTDDGKVYLSNTNTDNLNPVLVGDATKYINVTESNVADFAQDALDWIQNATAIQSVAGNDGDVTVDDLALGYYLVYPRGATEIKNDWASICSLTNNIPDATIQIKAEYPDIEKDEETPVVSGDIGSSVPYVINGTVPDTTGFTSYTYKITDTMTGLKFNNDITVKIGDADAVIVTSTSVPAGYTLTVNDDGFVLTIPVLNETAGEEIVVNYSATITGSTINTVAKNSAKLTYSNNPKENTTSDSTIDEEEVYSSKVVIDKYDGTTSTKLEGAVFALKNGDGDDAKYYKFTAATTDAPAKVDWVGSADEATKVRTDGDGAATFDGLANGTYYLEEITAPTGYNKLEELVSVEVNKNATSAVGVSVTAQVPNNSGSTLPSTGGMGTTLFYVFGGVLVAAAVVLLVTKKRMSAAE